MTAYPHPFGISDLRVTPHGEASLSGSTTGPAITTGYYLTETTTLDIPAARMDALRVIAEVGKAEFAATVMSKGEVRDRSGRVTAEDVVFLWQRDLVELDYGSDDESYVLTTRGRRVVELTQPL